MELLTYKWKNEKEEKGGWYPLPKYLTHKDMAGMIASTRETVTFLINKWVQQGMIKNDKQQIWIK
ncbi:helix-turn-helix domain-containing protein [Virgibacillus proomii]|uniref:helix-turn-helix domain-containing protein n=1 Tax=Virgibacillus proomii TaxID=84407 RepID=UPI000984D902|nr:helix-turn-helix domain-containing protein [Virgibacillus proomii]